MRVATGRKKWLTWFLVGLLTFAACWIGLWGWGAYHERAARAALVRRDFTAARYHLKQVASVRFNDVTLCMLEAQTARRQGEFDEAFQLLRLCRDDANLRDERDLEYQRLRVQQGDLTEFDQLWNACLQHPDAPATELTLEALIEGSLTFFENAFEAGTTFLSGESLQALARTSKAVELYLRNHPGAADQSPGLVWRSRIWILQNQRECAADALRAAVARDASQYQARFHLARALFQTAPAEAADHLDILRKLRPQAVEVYLPLAQLRRGQRRFDEARQILDGLLATDGNQANVLLERGNVALDAEEPREAEPFLRQAMVLVPDNPQYVLPLSRCLHLLHQHAEAAVLQERYQRLEAERVRATEAWLQKARAVSDQRDEPSSKKK